MQEFVRALASVLLILLPILAGTFMSPVVVPWLSALSALLVLTLAVTWAPVQGELRRLRRLYAMMLLAVVSVIVVPGTYWIVLRWADAKMALPVDVRVTQIHGGPWEVDDWSKGKDGNPGVLRGQRIILGRVSITNRSPTNRVNLRFRLQANLLRPDGTKTPFFIDEEVGRPKSPPSDVQPALLGPLDVGPETTVLGTISFYVMGGAEALGGGTVSYDHRVGGNVLTVTDLVSDRSRDFKVPTSMGGTVNRLH